MLSFQICWWLKNPAVWLDEKLLVCNLTCSIFQILRLTRKIYNWKIFHFSIFPRKNTISRKLKKSLFWTRFEQLVLISGQTRIFLENPHLPFFGVSRFLLPCKISQKTNQPIPRETSYRRSDWRTSMNS